MSVAKKKAAPKRKKAPDNPAPAIHQEVPAVRCPKCGSTERTAYHRIKSMTFRGQTVTWKATECLSCGQRRIDRVVV